MWNGDYERVELSRFDVSCVYYDEGSNDWQATGLRVANVGANDVVCEASHLTQFTLVYSSTLGVEPVTDNSIAVPDKVPDLFFFCTV